MSSPHSYVRVEPRMSINEIEHHINLHGGNSIKLLPDGTPMVRDDTMPVIRHGETHIQWPRDANAPLLGGKTPAAGLLPNVKLPPADDGSALPGVAVGVTGYVDEFTRDPITDSPLPRSGHWMAPTELPQYLCHKKVRALKIKKVAHEGDGAWLLFPANNNFVPFTVEDHWARTHGVVDGGYYVVYDDGYKSFSPAKAFEDGYSILENLSMPSMPPLNEVLSGCAVRAGAQLYRQSQTMRDVKAHAIEAAELAIRSRLSSLIGKLNDQAQRDEAIRLLTELVDEVPLGLVEPHAITMEFLAGQENTRREPDIINDTSGDPVPRDQAHDNSVAMWLISLAQSLLTGWSPVHVRVESDFQTRTPVTVMTLTLRPGSGAWGEDLPVPYALMGPT